MKYIADSPINFLKNAFYNTLYINYECQPHYFIITNNISTKQTQNDLFAEVALSVRTLFSKFVE